MRVELLHHPGCRSASAVYRLVQDCLTALGMPTVVQVRVGAYPSPTVLVDGADVMDPSRGTPLGYSCRLDVPTPEHLVAALTAHPATRPAELVEPQG